MALIFAICLPALIAVGGNGMSGRLGPFYVVGAADTTKSFVISDTPGNTGWRGKVEILRGPSGANDTLHLLFDYSFQHADGTSKRSEIVWRRFDSVAVVISDTAIASWPKTFVLKTADSLGTYLVRCRGRISDDATTDTTLTATGVSFLLDLWEY
jgi:hypothetical protein